MKGAVSYRQLVISPNGERWPYPLTAPVNDLLGLFVPERNRPARTRASDTYWLRLRYQPFVAKDELISDARKTGVWADFLNAATSATRGHVAAQIASYLERLTFKADGSVDVPDFPAFAAWSLLEAVRRQPLKLFTCPNCKGKWLGAPDESKFCQRLAPGQPSKTCRELDYERGLAGRPGYAAYRREYKRLTEANRRGAIELPELLQWRQENAANAWLPFEDWKAKRKENADA